MSVTVNALTKTYGQQKAVDNIGFRLEKGEIVGFLGPNGAGKSTTMKIITTYLPATSGTVSVCGYDVNDQAMEVRKKIGYLPESNPLYYEMYVREYLEFSAGIHKISANKNSRIDDIIARTGLTKEKHKKIGALSKGYKQRVGLAQALLHDPEILILDEPTSGLDPNQIVEIRDLIKQAGQDKTVLLSTHIMQEVQAMCNRVIIINNGKIVADGSIESVKAMNNHQDVLTITFEKTVNQALFAELKHARSIENISGNSWKFLAEHPEMLRKEVMQWSLTHDIGISSMQLQTESLEDVFRAITHSS
jgi:ABC-2 type transport system ATP-binding protein